MNKKGLSQIVGAMILVLITVAGVAIVGTSTRVFVKDKLDNSQSCFELTDQIKVNDDFSCYNVTRNITHVSIIRKDVDLKKIRVTVIMEENSFSFELTNESITIPLVQNYPNNDTGVKIPSKEGSRTYIVEGITSYPEKIVIAPETEETSCGIVDSFENIPVC